MYLCVYSSTHICKHAYVHEHTRSTQYLIYGLCLHLSKRKYNGMASWVDPLTSCLLLYHTLENYECVFWRGQTGFSDLLTNNIQPIWWMSLWWLQVCDHFISLANLTAFCLHALMKQAPCGKSSCGQNRWTANDQPPSRKWIQATARSRKASPSLMGRGVSRHIQWSC